MVGLPIFAVTALHALLVHTVNAEKGTFGGWKPHAYCNDLDRIDASKIEPLTDEQAARVESLVQVQIVARHGARAPYARLFCWDRGQKKHNPMNAVWNCTKTEVSSQDIGYTKNNLGYGRLYAKTYMNHANLLNGTCVIGGLLPTGREQHHRNGEHLRAAYIGKGSLNLFSTDDLLTLDESSIYLRSDDQERTVGSGMALVDGLFPPENSGNQSFLPLDQILTWHVADMANDHINTNDRICPMMQFVADKANGSPTFQQHITNPQIKHMEHEFHQIVGNFTWDTILECLSTARCNNLEMPHNVTETVFTNVFNEVQTRQGLFLTFNESEYAKVTMQPLIHELLKTLDKAVAKEPNAPKLAITMGHDSTLMPLMAAIQREHWDRKWTPYAAMLVMELYSLKTGGYAIRLVFQGIPITVPECHDQVLCDLPVFMKAVEFARTPRNCKDPREDPDVLATRAFWRRISQYISSLLLLGLVVVCALLGFYSRRQAQTNKRERWYRSANEGADERATLLS